MGARGECTGYRITGHALYAPSGQDIVCAAVSCLAITCCNALETVTGKEPQARIEDGLLDVTVCDPGHDAQVILQVLRQGLKDLQAQYPKHIRVNEIVKMEE